MSLSSTTIQIDEANLTEALIAVEQARACIKDPQIDFGEWEGAAKDELMSIARGVALLSKAMRGLCVAMSEGLHSGFTDFQATDASEASRMAGL